MRKNIIILGVLICILLAGYGVNSVTKKQLENVNAGDVLVYRFRKDGKTWFYADKITHIEGDNIFYNPGKMEASAANIEGLKDFVTDKELSVSKAGLLKYETEQGDNKKVIIWIR